MRIALNDKQVMEYEAGRNEVEIVKEVIEEHAPEMALAYCRAVIKDEDTYYAVWRVM